MKLLIALLLISYCCIGAEPATKPEAAAGGQPAITDESNSPGKSPGVNARPVLGTSEFQNDEIGLVLRVLARQAGVSVLIDDSVTGTVTMRVDNQTPRATLEIICVAKNLVMEEKKGVFVIRSRNPPSMAGHGLLMAALVLVGFLALIGWFAAGLSFQRRSSAAAVKSESL